MELPLSIKEMLSNKKYSRKQIEGLITKLFHQIHKGELTCNGEMVDFKISPKGWLDKNLL